jgi:hypothetical protein
VDFWRELIAMRGWTVAGLSLFEFVGSICPFEDVHSSALFLYVTHAIFYLFDDEVIWLNWLNAILSS